MTWYDMIWHEMTWWWWWWWWWWWGCASHLWHSGRWFYILHVRFIAANISKKQYLQEQVCSLLSSELFMHCNWWIRSDLQNWVRSTFFGPKRVRARSASAKLCHESLGEFHVMVWRSGVGGPSPKSHAHFVVEGCYVQKLTFETVPWDAFFWQKSAIVKVHYEVRRQFDRFYSDFPWFGRCPSVPRGWTGLGGFEAGNGEREVVRPLRVSCRSADSVDRRGVQFWDFAYICVQTCADNIPLHLHLSGQQTVKIT